MTIEQMRARLKEIFAKIEILAGIEDLNDAQVGEVNSLNTEAGDLTKKIEAKEKIASMQASVGASNRKTTPDVGTVEVKASAIEKSGGFKNFGEFALAVKRQATGGNDPRFQNAMFEKNGEDGGFLIPDQLLPEVLKKVTGDPSLLSSTRQFNVSGNNLAINIDELNPGAGIRSYWTEEGGTITESKHKFSQASWRLHKLASLVLVTDELLSDASGLESYINTEAPNSIAHAINAAILFGNGVGKPTGVLNSGFKVINAKESGQTADTIVARNVIKMYNRMIPSSRARAVWYINPECEDQLRTMKDDNDNFIYLSAGSQLNQNPYGMLLGRPVMPLLFSGMKALGDEGDIIFADLSMYYTIVKSPGVQSSMSQHLAFDQDKTAFKFISRIDGSCPYKAPIELASGYKMSSFVTLEDR